MNRAQFQEWLNQFPADTEIEVMVQGPAPTWESYGACNAQEFDGSLEHYDYVDFKGNPHVKEDEPHYNKRFLTLGSGD